MRYILAVLLVCMFAVDSDAQAFYYPPKEKVEYRCAICGAICWWYEQEKKIEPSWVMPYRSVSPYDYQWYTIPDTATMKPLTFSVTINLCGRCYRLRQKAFQESMEWRKEALLNKWIGEEYNRRSYWDGWFLDKEIRERLLEIKRLESEVDRIKRGLPAREKSIYRPTISLDSLMIFDSLRVNPIRLNR